MSRIRVLIGLLLLDLLFVAGCKHTTSQGAAHVPAPAVQISSSGVDAAEPVTVSAADGTFYVAWVNHDAKQADVMVARFGESGQMQGSPVRVNRQPGVATAWRGDQPSVAVASDGAVYVVWTARVNASEKLATNIYMSVSNDGGQTFGDEVKVNDDKAATDHGMHSLAVAKDGRIYVGWLDERNVRAPKHAGKNEGHQMESNRELYIAYSTDGGRTFSANRKVASEACPCCKTALAVSADGTLYAGWRQVLPGSFRHIAVANSTDGGTSFSKPVIVSDDRWVLQGCPVSGPSLAVDQGGSLRVLWYAAGEADPPGLYFADSADKGQTFSHRQLVSQEVVRGTPVLTTGKNGPLALWQASEVAETKIAEPGKTGSAVRVAANAELPAGVFLNGKLFVAYIATEKDKRSVWLVTAG